jgi:hypothetical protein
MAHWNNTFAVALPPAAGMALPRESVRIVTGEDATAYPFQRTHPILLRAGASAVTSFGTAIFPDSWYS